MNGDLRKGTKSSLPFPLVFPFVNSRFEKRYLDCPLAPNNELECAKKWKHVHAQKRRGRLRSSLVFWLHVVDVLSVPLPPRRKKNCSPHSSLLNIEWHMHSESEVDHKAWSPGFQASCPFELERTFSLRAALALPTLPTLFYHRVYFTWCLSETSFSCATKKKVMRVNRSMASTHLRATRTPAAITGKRISKIVPIGRRNWRNKQGCQRRY